MIEEIAGVWEGTGVTTEDDPFTVRLELAPAADGNGMTLAFRALREDGEIFYRQRGIIAAERLAFVDSHVGELKILDRLQGTAGYSFGSGDPEDRDSYRVAVRFDLVDGGELDLMMAWALPDEDFKDHYHGRLKRIEER